MYGVTEETVQRASTVSVKLESTSTQMYRIERGINLHTDGDYHGA